MKERAEYFIWAVLIFLGLLGEFPGTPDQCCLLLPPTKHKVCKTGHSDKFSTLRTEAWVHLTLMWKWVSSADKMEMRGEIPPVTQFPREILSWFIKHLGKNYCLSHPGLWEDKALTGQCGSISEAPPVPIGFGGGNIRAEVPSVTLMIPHHLIVARGNPKMTPSCPTSVHHVAI